MMGSHRIRNWGGGILALFASCVGASAQPVPPPPSAQSQNPVCVRLEGQLAAVDRGSYDPVRAEQIRRYEDAVAKQQNELDRVATQSQRLGCQGSGFFSLFSGQPAQCGPLTDKIQQMHANMDRMLGDLQRLKGGTADRDAQRRSVLVALAQNNCGPQYRTAVVTQPRGFFESLFSPGSSIVTPNAPDAPDASQSGTYKTVCVRTCDGYYFPISFATLPNRFPEDERACQRLCPNAQVSLYTFRNPGEDVNQAVSLTGQPYTDLPTAFQYRKALNPACSCKRTGETWADALKSINDDTVERGDIVVTKERAKQMSQPQPVRAPKGARGRANATSHAPNGAPASASPPQNGAATHESDTSKRKVRTVGPAFLVR